MEDTCVLSDNDKNEGNVLNSLKLLRTEILDLYLPKEIPTVYEIPKPLEFYRNWVAPNIPVLIKGGIKNWVALQKWSKEYFCEKFGNKKISVSATPDGYADAITETFIDGKKVELFVLPEEKLMNITEFYDKLNNVDSNPVQPENKSGVFYIQKQNSNLTEEFPELLPDIDSDLTWASETFQSKPAAINLWIGDERAVTSLHKDPFENIYCVVSGYKEFILLPPTDRPWLQYKTLPVGQYKETSEGVFEIKMFASEEWVKKDTEKGGAESSCSYTEQNKVPWIAVDPGHPNYEKYPLYKYASPLRVKVERGDILYLPSLWFHYVRQSHKCIAVNYWYDMSFDIKYAYFQLLENLTKSLEEHK